MRQVPIKLGPLALLLTVISICLTTLAILVFTTARADMRLAEKYADTVQTRYALEAEGQAYLAALADGTEQPPETGEDWVLDRTLEKDGSLLRIGLVSEAGEVRVSYWRHERTWTEDTDIGSLWTGN